MNALRVITTTDFVALVMGGFALAIGWHAGVWLMGKVNIR